MCDRWSGRGVEVCGVVKADAYGHGALEVSRVLVAEGAKWLAVSSVDEGANLRCGGIHETRILVMGGFLPYEGEALVEYGLTPAVHSLEQIRQVDQLARSSGKPLRYHLKIDSGMGRLGTRAAAAEIVASAPRNTTRAARRSDDALRLGGRLLHRPDRRSTRLLPRHRGANCEAAGYARRSPAHLEHQRDRVRPHRRLAQHGARGPCPLRIRFAGAGRRPAATAGRASRADLEGQAAGRQRYSRKARCVGYGGSFRAPRPMRIGIVGAGYADGMFHRLSNRGKIIAAGKLTPILGTISMDLTTIDLSHTQALGPGDDVTLLGAEGDAGLDAQQIARVAGTISYNILCSISARVRRVYV